ncbi:hypothetical protein KIN20_001463 [Parelaphostrongylus tenuis]|uniref:Uncharacterized protein n=1 Tax=Parelaphostrongylus tenuis TaxID=148309 RepID=A0AAD5LTP8_PARTN|nr:hypothetical protein KIN20_001463 [Parelaphostrongylus tenuis]
MAKVHMILRVRLSSQLIKYSKNCGYKITLLHKTKMNEKGLRSSLKDSKGRSYCTHGMDINPQIGYRAQLH